MAMSLPLGSLRAMASVAMAVTLVMVAVLLSAVVVLFPITFSLVLIGLLGLSVLFLMAVILPGHIDAPGGFLRGMLAVVMVVAAVWPGYIAYKYGAAPGVNPTRLVYWGLITLWMFWLGASPGLRAQLYEKLARFKVPVRVVFAEIPKTSTGKIQKFKLREMAKKS